jgi:hypothetical protein
MAIIAMLTGATLGFDPRLRACFGPGFRVPLLRFEVPGSLVLLGGGFAIVGLAGLLDDAWHSTFGLDETGWSTPHSMLGWGLFVLFTGFIAARLSLARHRPMSWYTPYLMAYGLLAFSAAPFMGPIYANHTPEAVRAIASVPVLEMQPAFQHTARIHLEWNLTRTSPLFVPLVALWCGAAFAMIRALDPRNRVLLGGALLFTLLSGEKLKADFLDQRLGSALGDDPANYLGLLAVLPAALLALVVWLRADERIGYALAGAAMGALAYATWGVRGPAPEVALAAVGAAPVLALLGARAGRWVIGVAKEPLEIRVKVLLPVLGIGMPLLTGLADLYLRMNTA